MTRLTSDWRSFVRVSRYLVIVVGVLLIGGVLSGCLAALQPDQQSAYPAPPMLPSGMPDTVVPTDQVLLATVVPTVLLPEPSPTLMASPEPVATPTATSLATASATATPVPLATPTPEAPLIVPTLPILTNEERWRAQELQRTIFDPPRLYTTTSSELWWFDPINQQHVILGTFAGDFLVQAQFTLRGQGVAALEVPYHVNLSYGLTALSPAIIARIAAAGSSEWIETYVFMTPNVLPR